MSKFGKAAESYISAMEKAAHDRKARNYAKHAQEVVDLVEKAAEDSTLLREILGMICTANSAMKCYLYGQIFEYLCRPVGSSLGLKLQTAGEVDCYVSIDGRPRSVECKVQGGTIEAILARYEAGLKPRTEYVVYFCRYTSKVKHLRPPVIVPTNDFARFILEHKAYKIGNGNNGAVRVCQPLVAAYDELVDTFPVFTPFAKTSERAKSLTVKNFTDEERAWLALLYACYTK